MESPTSWQTGVFILPQTYTTYLPRYLGAPSVKTKNLQLTKRGLESLNNSQSRRPPEVAPRQTLDDTILMINRKPRSPPGSLGPRHRGCLDPLPHLFTPCSAQTCLPRREPRERKNDFIQSKVLDGFPWL